MYAAVFLPRFGLQAALRWRAEYWQQPVVLSDPDTGDVWETTPAAEARDIRPGMPVSQAMGRCPSLQVFTRSPEQEQALTGLLHETALAHSPLVEATALGAATLDWRGAHHQLGWHTLGDHLVRDLQAVGLKSQVAVARTPDVALLAARETETVSVVRDSGGLPASLPVAFLRPPEELLAILRDWGVATVGDFLATAANRDDRAAGRTGAGDVARGIGALASPAPPYCPTGGLRGMPRLRASHRDYRASALFYCGALWINSPRACAAAAWWRRA